MKYFEDGKMTKKTNHCLKTLSDGGVEENSDLI
jgi:hypothetical protein